MKKQFYINVLLMLVSLIVLGCSSLQSQDKADKGFSDFLSQSQHYALFSPVLIESEEKLGLFGVSDYGQRISQENDIRNPILNVITKLTESMPSLSRTTIIHPEEVNDLPLPHNYPVLFFHSDWRFIYRRIPPSFSMNKLQVGIIAKIIPFGQVLNNHGPTALRTASWEGKCFYEVFDGKYFSLDEWEADNGNLLNKGIEEAQNYCSKKFITEFSDHLTSR